MKKLSRLRFCTILCLAIMLFACIVPAPAYANSAQMHFSGTDATGAIVNSDRCPIIVEKELLTFDIQEFPQNYYHDDEEDAFLAYTGKVTAQYTFHNPASYDVTATLVFPFGNAPSYSTIYNWGDNFANFNLDTQKYGITVDGTPVETTLRFTHSHQFDQFELEYDMAKLHSGYVYDSFYRPDMPVTRYVYMVSDLDEKTYRSAFASFNVNIDPDKTRIYFPEMCGFSGFDDGSMNLGNWADNSGINTIYVIGEPLSEPPEWTMYENGAEEKVIDSGKVTLVNTMEMTFADLVFKDYDANSLVSETDWYNAFVHDFNQNSGGSYATIHSYSTDISHDLMRWYEYQITIPAGGTIVNEVTAPIYPAIDISYEPAKFDYTYLLSPATTWSEFGNLDIVINTPYYMLDNTLDEFEKTDYGYTLSLDGLPDGELEFTLASSENPVYNNSYGSGMLIYIVFFVSIIAVVLLVIALIIVFVHRKRKKKKALANMPMQDTQNYQQ